MKQRSYKVGGLAIVGRTPQVIKSSKNRPAMRVSVSRIPRPHRQGVPLLCVPTAYWNACQMAGIAQSVDVIGEAKRGVNRSGGTNPHDYALSLLAVVGDDLDVSRFRLDDDVDFTLRTAVDFLLAGEYRTAVLTTRTPCHCFAVQISEGGGAVHLVDNGGFAGVGKWRGGNIDGVFGVRCKRPDLPLPPGESRRIVTGQLPLL